MLLDTIPDLEMTGRQRAPVAGEVPSPINPAIGLHLPSALPVRQRALQDRAAAVIADRRRPGRLPRDRGETHPDRGSDLRRAVLLVVLSEKCLQRRFLETRQYQPELKDGDKASDRQCQGDIRCGRATAEREKAVRMRRCRSLNCEVARNLYAIGEQAS
jgi:hypothetical protein